MTKAQCDPNITNNSGQTPLHHGAEYLVLRVSFCVGNVLQLSCSHFKLHLSVMCDV